MNAKLLSAVDRLAENNRAFQAGEIKSVQHGNAREKDLVCALEAIASMHDVTFLTPLFINGRGEFTLLSIDPAKGWYQLNQAPYGAGLAALLTGHNARTGASPGAQLRAESNWCSMSHFDVERMVKAHADTVLDSQEARDEHVNTDAPSSQ